MAGNPSTSLLHPVYNHTHMNPQEPIQGPQKSRRRGRSPAGLEYRTGMICNAFECMRLMNQPHDMQQDISASDDVDQELLGEMVALSLHEDLPYCFHCDKYFANATVRDEHFKMKHGKLLKTAHSWMQA